jgi:PTS system ascorbate-specific IIB component
MEIVTLCGCGVGSSVMLRMNAQNILRKNGIKANITISDMTGVKGLKGDLLITTQEILKGVGDLSGNFKEIMLMKNLVNKNELQEKLLHAVEKLKD